MLRGGIDIGGTFTDLVFIDDESGKMISHKKLTTSHDPAIGVLDGIKQSDIDLNNVWLLVHGSTIVINAIISRTGAKTGLITSEGFRDVLEIGRGNRLVSFDIYHKKPEPLIPRKWRIAVPERVDCRGNTLAALQFKEVQKALDYFLKEGVESIAVCFLHSYANSKNEHSVKQLVESEYKDFDVSISSEILPEIREYERTSTTVVNAYVKPIVRKYIEGLESELIEQGYAAELYLMQSNGGIMNSAMAKSRPVEIIESGPIGGVVAAKYVGELVGLQNGVIFDMGGTTSKAALISAGDINVTSEYCPAGYPIRIPVADMIELGIGGGSIGWIDEGGFPQVGPTSSGAAPGPACYDLGGLEPTITDANVVLGRVRNLLGGDMELNKQKAEEAILTKLANPLHLDLLRAAEGIIEIAVAKIVDIMRAVSVSKGIDIRDFAMFAFGGAGPMHSAFIAKELGLNTIVVPPSPGTFSALGFLCSDLRHDFVKTSIMNTREISLVGMEDIFNKLESQGVETLRKEGVEPGDIILMKSVDMRYVGQAHEINIPFHPGGVSASVAAELIRLFHQTYQQHYGHASPGEATEIVNFRVTAVGRVKKAAMVKKSEKKGKGALKGRADVYFKETGWTDCSIYQRDDLGYGAGIDGPAIIEESTATTVILPDMQADIDEYGNIILRWS